MARSTKIYGPRLRRARERLCLTQTELGAMLGGMSDENVGRIERADVAGIMTKKLPLLAQALKMPLEQLQKELVVAAGKTSPPPTRTIRLPAEIYDFLIELSKKDAARAKRAPFTVEEYIIDHVKNRGYRAITRPLASAAAGKRQLEVPHAQNTH